MSEDCAAQRAPKLPQKDAWGIRFLLCSGLAIIGGGVLGAAYGAGLLMMSPRTLGGAGSFWIAFVGAIYGGIIGAFIGLLTSPVPAFFLMHKEIDHAWPLVYGVSSLIAVLSHVILPSWSFVITIMGWLACCIGASLWLSRAWPPDVRLQHLCRSCGYDLRNLTLFKCPECGLHFDQNPLATNSPAPTASVPSEN